jgi:hypothetical protein
MTKTYEPRTLRPWYEGLKTKEKQHLQAAYEAVTGDDPRNLHEAYIVQLDPTSDDHFRITNVSPKTERHARSFDHAGKLAYLQGAQMTVVEKNGKIRAAMDVVIDPAFGSKFPKYGTAAAVFVPSPIVEVSPLYIMRGPSLSERVAANLDPRQAHRPAYINDATLTRLLDMAEGLRRTSVPHREALIRSLDGYFTA